MKKQRLIAGICLAVGLISFSQSVTAGTGYYQYDDSAANSEPGSWYIGGAVGRSYSNVKGSDFYLNPEVSSTGTAGKAYVGYLFNQNLGLEFSYFQFKTFHISPRVGVQLSQPGGNIQAKALELSAVGIFPATTHFSLGVSAGAFLPSYSADSSIIYAGQINREAKSRFGLGYGLFGQYMIEQNAYLRAGWDQLLNNGPNTHLRPNTCMGSVGLTINLGNN